MSPRRRRRLSWEARRRLRFALIGLGALVLVAGIAASVRLVQAARHMRAAEQLIDDAGDAIVEGRVAEARDLLTRATSRLGGAAGALHNHLELDVVRAIPFLGDNVRELRTAVALASQLTSGGAQVLEAAQPLQRVDGSLEVPLRRGALPLDAIRAVQARTEALVGVLPDEEELADDPGFLIGPVEDLHERVVEEVVRRRAQLQSLSDGLALAMDMSGGSGPRAYLIAVANTAEMRGTGGMILSYGGLLGADGDFELSEFGRIDDVILDGPISRDFVPDLPDDYVERWTGFDPLLRWRNANLGGDFSVVAPVLEAMFGQATGVAVDGVIQIDPEGLAAILEGTGPVEVPRLGTVSADNLVALVLNEAYFRFRGIEQRSDVLRDVAEAAFDKLVTGQYDSLRPLGTALVEAVQGRHILFHARSEATEARIRSFGADGALPRVDGSDAFHLTVQNVSGNKLDYYVDTTLGLSGDLQPAQPGQLRAEILVQNTAPVGATEPRYVFGPFNDDQVAGTYRGVVTLYVPRGTSLVESSGDSPRDPPVVDTEDGRPLVSYTIDLPAGQSHRVVLDLVLPPRRDRPYEMIVVPSPRIRPTTLQTDLDTGRGRIQERLTLDRTWRIGDERDPEPVSGLLEEEASLGVGAYGMLRRSTGPARTAPRTRRE